VLSATIIPAMLRTQLYADPNNVFVHNAILDSCRTHAEKTALVDTSCGRRLTYAEYGDTVEALARGLVAAGVKPGEVVAIFLSNSWEFCAAYHAVTLAGGIPTLLNPTYREREVRYQLGNSGAVVLITDGPNISGINLAELPNLRRVFCTREQGSGSEPFSDLLKPVSATLPEPALPSDETLAALPYSSGTTGLPKGVMLSHRNLVANVYQLLGPGAAMLKSTDNLLCFLPLYHIYGLNVALNPILILGATLVLMPRFNPAHLIALLTEESITTMPVVPPAMNALCLAAEAGQFTAPATVEQALIIELRSAGRFQRRRFVYGAMGGAIAASLALALWMTWRPAPKVAVKQKPSVPTVSEPIVAAVPVRVITTRRPRTVHALAVQEQPFIAIPYTPPIEPYERTEVMRMDLPVTALIAAGLPMNMADPGEIVQTDVLVGQDGRARAVRLISMSDLN